MRAIVLVALLGACSSYAYSTFDRKPTPPPSVLEQGRRTNSLSGNVAVRHRRQLSKSPLSWNDIVVVANRLSSAPTPQAPPAAQPISSAGPAEPEKLVVETWIDLRTDNIAKTVVAIRTRVQQAGGRIVSENVVGPEKSASSAAMELRVPPGAAMDVTSWIAALGDVESRRVLASDVSKTLVDQQLELENLTITMKRLEELAKRDGPIDELLRIETEMTRVRGEIERVKGEQRWLIDRVEFATITVELSRDKEPVQLSPHARVFPGPRVSMLALFDPGMRSETRFGGGATLHVRRHLTLDLDVFPREDGDSRAVIATIGTALYSGYLGYGTRRFLNPYVGARIGYGYLSGDGGLALGAEVGVELFKHEYVLVETAVRAVLFARDTTDAALHALLGFSVPF
jgi:hypothetical protein